MRTLSFGLKSWQGWGRVGVPCHLVGKTGSLKPKLGGIVSLRYIGPRGGYDGNDGSATQ